jgi:hypothetical protein
MKIKIALAALTLVLSASAAFAQDVSVSGYYRSDGTYVRSHVRSAPDGDRSNNYGPSHSSSSSSLSTYNSLYTNPSARDHDRDGIANRYDSDDDNDGIGDNSDHSQYGRTSSGGNPRN